ncbi:hypothetical protein [Selenomonas sp. F0473]|uniref:hypothetical protein n=1 Tax=Selenomonas sp. F0473 TaxID=999423 RepID=UPI0025EBD7DA|nr:hypothetical protein [Selenomonas sp. F0473]
MHVDFMPDKTNPVDAQIMNIYIVTGNATNVQIVVNSAIYMTIADLNDALTAHNTAPDAHMDIRQLAENAGLNLLRRNKTYAIGDIAYSKNLPSWARLECIQAGTTAADEPAAIATVSTGGVLLSDGSVLWIIDDIRDGTPVGAVRGSLYLPAGYVKANGATVQRADYPRSWRGIMQGQASRLGCRILQARDQVLLFLVLIEVTAVISVKIFPLARALSSENMTVTALRMVTTTPRGEN